MILNTKKRYQIQKEKEKGTSEALKGYYAMQTTQVFFLCVWPFRKPNSKRDIYSYPVPENKKFN